MALIIVGANVSSLERDLLCRYHVAERNDLFSIIFWIKSFRRMGKI
jgi:hypothetical protein